MQHRFAPKPVASPKPVDTNRAAQKPHEPQETQKAEEIGGRAIHLQTLLASIARGAEWLLTN